MEDVSYIFSFNDEVESGREHKFAFTLSPAKDKATNKAPQIYAAQKKFIVFHVWAPFGIPQSG